MRRATLQAALLCLAWLGTPGAGIEVRSASANAAIIDRITAGSGELQLLGRGGMRWFGLHLYDAALWVPGGQWRWDDSFALDIRYARRFRGRALAEASVDEMRRLGYRDEATLERWQRAMEGAFPDVEKGDHITGFFVPGEGARFYHNGRLTAEVADPAFARAFFSIWLDAKTREPKLRAALLGLR